MEEQKDPAVNGAGRRRSKRGPKEEEIKRIGPVRVTEIQRPKVLVSQDRMRRISEYQAIAWQAEEIVHAEIAGLMRDLEHGAIIEPGPLEYDRALRMVRTKKEQKA